MALFTLLVSLVWAEPVVLHVNVNAAAGSVYDVVAEGTSGQCTVYRARLVCPASGPVRFRWGPSSRWEITGDLTLDPGEHGTAWVLAPEAARLEQRASLEWGSVTPAVVRDLFVRDGDHDPIVPSYQMLADLSSLSRHPDPLVRIQVAEAMMTWFSAPSTGVLPPDSPTPIPERVIVDLARDSDPRVRRRIARVLREARAGLLGEEAGTTLLELTGDPDVGVRRAALSAMRNGLHAELLPADLIWLRALRAVQEEGAPGRAAAKTLAYLAKDAVPGPVIRPQLAVELTLVNHPESAWKVWTKWRDVVPFRADWCETLIRSTNNMNRPLLRHWARTEPDALAQIIRRWEPTAPHSYRFKLAQRYLLEVTHPVLRSSLALGPIMSEETWP